MVKRGVASKLCGCIQFLSCGINVSTRRDQVVYTISTLKVHAFDAVSIEAVMRSVFPDAAKVKSLGVGQILRTLCGGANPLLRTNGGGKFRFSDPRYLMCIRLVMTRVQSGHIVKRSFAIG